jgi:hypothetical protein
VLTGNGVAWGKEETVSNREKHLLKVALTSVKGKKA